MNQHKHAEAIKSWADGATIQARNEFFEWTDIPNPTWQLNLQYRVKPEPKPDLRLFYWYELSDKRLINTNCISAHNLILTIDGVTGKLKSAEVL